MNPTFDYHALAPAIVLSATIILVLVADFFFPDRDRWQTSRIASFGVLAAMIPGLEMAAGYPLEVVEAAGVVGSLAQRDRVRVERPYLEMLAPARFERGMRAPQAQQARIARAHAGVGRVVGYYREFLGRFPTPAACAEAPVADVVRAWQGLGYNRRAVNLHRCARAVVADHGGRRYPAASSWRGRTSTGP